MGRRRNLSDVETRDRGQVLSVRFTAAELEELRQRAEQAGVPVSAFVRRFALERANPNSLASRSVNHATPTDELVVDTDHLGGGWFTAGSRTA